MSRREHIAPTRDRVSGEIVALTPLLRTVLAGRVDDPDHVDDLVQECLARLVAVTDRLTPDTLAGYAVAVARNVATSHRRRLTGHRRRLPLLVDLRRPADPADEAVKSEDIAALRRAVAQLDPEDRRALVAHDVHDVTTATLAAETDTTPGGVASRLNRTRGRLRVDYMVALEGVSLPSPRCHQVLVALSTADARRQRALDASRHLASCDTCASLSPPLLERRRGALALLPGVAALRWWHRLGSWLRTHLLHTGVGTAVVGAATATVLVVALSGGHRPRTTVARSVAATVAPRAAATPVPPARPVVGYFLADNKGGVAYFDITGANPASAQPLFLPDHQLPGDAPVVALASTADGRGLYEAAADGSIFAYGDARLYGSEAGRHLNAPIVGMVTFASSAGARAGTGGYAEVAADGGIFTFGPGARFYGSTATEHLNAPIVGMASTPDGRGYWLVAADGGVFNFGDARFYGSAGGAHLNDRIVGMNVSADGRGYVLVGADGGVFAFGDSRFYGSEGGHRLDHPVVAIATTPDGGGYWLAAADGASFAFGDAPYIQAHLVAASPDIAAISPTSGAVPVAPPGTTGATPAIGSTFGAETRWHRVEVNG